MYIIKFPQEYCAISDGRFAMAKYIIPEILDSIDVKLICKFFVLEVHGCI